MKYLAGIDVGTTGTKCLIIDEAGGLHAACTENYPCSTPNPGWSEQIPEDWWQATRKAMRRAVQASGVDRKDITALGFSGQMHGLVALDEADKTIRPAILWNDQRTDKECQEIIATAGGLERLIGYTNNSMLTGFTGGKILWLRKNEQEHYHRMRSFLMPKDYVRFRLTGEKATDVSDASGTGLFDVRQRTWCTPLIKMLDLKPELFPKVHESDEIAGHVTKAAAQELGLPEGTPVFAGGGDAVIQTTGMGIVKEGTIGLIIGTSGIVSMSLDHFYRNSNETLQFFCNNDKKKWQVFGCQLSSGGSMEWLKNTLYPEDSTYEHINEEVEASIPGAHKLLFLPYLTGERSPYADPYARGVFFGLASFHTRDDLARAVMEGVTFGLKDIYGLIRLTKPDLDPKEIISSGGASKSAVWRQVQADIFGLPVKTLTGAAEGGAYGAAIVAGVGAGVWKDIEQAAESLTVETVTEPKRENREIYQHMHEVYRKLYGDLKQDFLQLK